MEILSGETSLVLFVDLCNELNLHTHDFWFRYLSIKTTIHNERKSQVICLNQNWRTSTLNFPVPYEKDTTIESDSKQWTMSWWNQLELGLTSTKQIFVTVVIDLFILLFCILIWIIIMSQLESFETWGHFLSGDLEICR